MKTIILYAYDKVNLGDDLFLHTITKRYPSVRFLLWSSKENKKTFSSLRNLRVIDRENNFFQMLNRIHPSLVARYKNWQEKRADAVVYIGGSIFIEYESWPLVLNWWNYQVDHHRLYVLGANFGPFHSETYRAAMAKVFDRAQDVCFRDRYSCELFERHRVRWAPDILFGCPMPKKKEIKHQVFLSVINCEKKNEGDHTLGVYQNQYMENLIELMQVYLQRGYHVVLSSFCKAEGDEEVISALEQHFREKTASGKVQPLCYDGTNADALLEAIAESEFVIASRFHAVILGLAAGRPVFPIIYSDKTFHVLDDMGFCGHYLDLRRQEAISIADVEANRTQCGTVSAEVLHKEAEGHFRVLDRELCVQRNV